MVQVKINGDHRIIELNIEPEAVDSRRCGHARRYGHSRNQR